VRGPTHYDVLQVPPSATTSEIREAYRRLARDHHPDRLASRPIGAADVTMPEINEAYRVLNDAARRAVYDAQLRGGSAATVERGPAAPPRYSTSASSSSSADSAASVYASHQGPARIPWRSLLFVGVLASVAIVALAQFVEPGEPRGPDGLIDIGSCVSIEPNGDAREIACVGDPAVDLVVEAFVPFSATCPTGTLAHRDRQGMGIACVGDPGEIPG
jgi:molecular chaperone DnaJ